MGRMDILPSLVIGGRWHKCRRKGRVEQSGRGEGFVGFQWAREGEMGYWETKRSARLTGILVALNQVKHV
jgi:hypothetical protein